jgi:hypothetical protein
MTSAHQREDTLPVRTPHDGRLGSLHRVFPARPARGWARELRALPAEHWPFAVLLLLATGIRGIVMLGYPPAMFFNDSYNYVTDAVTMQPDVVRANGYPFFLRLLLPFHSLALVTGLQALMGLGMGVAVYALLRRRGLPWWGATIPALPVLFDVWEMQLEHTIAADTLFTTLIVAAVVMLCWWERPPLWAVIVAGLLVGYSATVRGTGEPLLVVFAVAMFFRRAGWRRLLAMLAAGVIPIAGYMAWFHLTYGSYAITESSGTFLYSRVSSFAECPQMSLPPAERVLCDPRPPGERGSSQEYLWANDTPLGELTGTNNIYRFTPHIESLTSTFAERAILSQPLDYIAVVADDAARTFGWHRFQSDLAGSGYLFRFESTTATVPGWVTTNQANLAAIHSYGGPSLGRPTVVQPWAGFLQFYERQAYLRGPFLGLFLLAGLAGVVLAARRRRAGDQVRARWSWGGPALLPWLIGVALILIPPMTAGFSYRYVLAAVPASCLAAGLAFAERGSLIGWLRARGS